LDGIFCSAGCALTYIRATAGKAVGRQVLLFREIAGPVFGVKGVIKPAPERRWLRDFCGDIPGSLSIAEFRAASGPQAAGLRTLRPPFVPVTVVQERPSSAAAAPGAEPASSTAILAGGGHVIRGLRRPRAGEVAIQGETSVTTSVAGGVVEAGKPGLYTEFVKKKVTAAGAAAAPAAAEPAGAALAAGGASAQQQHQQQHQQPPQRARAPPSSGAAKKGKSSSGPQPVFGSLASFVKN
jgi:hypothetical protein